MSKNILFLKDSYTDSRVEYLFNKPEYLKPSSRFFILAAEGRECESACNQIISSELSPLKLILLEPTEFSLSKACHIHIPTLILSVPNTAITDFAKALVSTIPNCWHGVESEESWGEHIDQFLELPNKRSQLKKRV